MASTNASVKGIRLSAQKGRLVADVIRGKPVEKALDILKFMPQKGASIIRKVLESAIDISLVFFTITTKAVAS